MTAVNQHAEELRSRLPAALLGDDTAPYIIEGVAPGLVVSPETQADVATVLAAANGAGAAVVPWGAGTQQHLGMPPERYDLALDLRRLNRVVEYEPADLTVTVEAGVTLSELQQRLGENGQWLPLDPRIADEATIGGILATNASGPSRHAYGTARDLMIGVRFVTGRGDAVHAGGRVVKNVAGYDLGKLQIGALGSLGVITEATFKTAPLPARSESVITMGDLTALMSITARLLDARLAANLVVLSNRGDGWRLRVRFAGGNGAVERSLADFSAFAREAALTVEAPGDVGAAPVPEPNVIARAGVLSTSAAEISEALLAAGGTIVAYPTAGIVYGAWMQEAPSADTLRDLRRLCVETGRGALVIEKAPLALKREAGVWGETRDDFPLMQRLRSEFDPNRLLNPGRYVGGL